MSGAHGGFCCDDWRGGGRVSGSSYGVQGLCEEVDEQDGAHAVRLRWMLPDWRRLGFWVMTESVASEWFSSLGIELVGVGNDGGSYGERTGQRTKRYILSILRGSIFVLSLCSWILAASCWNLMPCLSRCLSLLSWDACGLLVVVLFANSQWRTLYQVELWFTRNWLQFRILLVKVVVLISTQTVDYLLCNFLVKI